MAKCIPFPYIKTNPMTMKSGWKLNSLSGLSCQAKPPLYRPIHTATMMTEASPNTCARITQTVKQYAFGDRVSFGSHLSMAVYPEATKNKLKYKLL